jgi:chromosome partitioning protein
MGKTIFIGTRKGGVGKTMTAASLGFGLARAGKRVLCIDADSQHSLTASLGEREPDKRQVSLASVMENIVNRRTIDPAVGILRHDEGVDFLPTNSSLTGIELALAPLIGRETILRRYMALVKPLYDYIIIDTAPTLDIMTINALVAADSVIIPVAPKFLDALGLEQLLKSVAEIQFEMNPNLAIEGILLTLVDRRSRFAKKVIAEIEEAYGGNIKVFAEYIPHSVRAAETSANGVSIYAHDPNGKVAAGYTSLVGEVLANG